MLGQQNGMIELIVRLEQLNSFVDKTSWGAEINSFVLTDNHFADCS